MVLARRCVKLASRRFRGDDARSGPTSSYLAIGILQEGAAMATVRLIEYAEASPEVRAVYDDIMATRRIDWVNNFWKALANHPPTMKRTWESLKQVMAP